MERVNKMKMLKLQKSDGFSVGHSGVVDQAVNTTFTCFRLIKLLGQTHAGKQHILSEISDS